MFQIRSQEGIFIAIIIYIYCSMQYIIKFKTIFNCLPITRSRYFAMQWLKEKWKVLWYFLWICMLVINHCHIFYYFRSKENLLFMFTLGTEHIYHSPLTISFEMKKISMKALGRIFVKNFNHWVRQLLTPSLYESVCYGIIATTKDVWLFLQPIFRSLLKKNWEPWSKYIRSNNNRMRLRLYSPSCQTTIWQLRSSHVAVATVASRKTQPQEYIGLVLCVGLNAIIALRLSHESYQGKQTLSHGATLLQLHARKQQPNLQHISSTMRATCKPVTSVLPWLLKSPNI